MINDDFELIQDPPLTDLAESYHFPLGGSHVYGRMMTITYDKKK